jgi:hypothetical protein
MHCHRNYHLKRRGAIRSGLILIRRYATVIIPDNWPVLLPAFSGVESSSVAKLFGSRICAIARLQRAVIDYY